MTAILFEDNFFKALLCNVDKDERRKSTFFGREESE